MKSLHMLLAIVLIGFSQSASALYLKFMHNKSSANVYLYASLPGGWVDVPKYPLLLLPGESFFDEAVFAKGLKIKRYSAKIKNVAMPASGKANAFSACNKNDAKHYIKIIVDGGPGIGYNAYRVYDCGWKINVEKRSGSNHWNKHKVSHEDWLKFSAGAKYWSMGVDSKGNLDVWGDKDIDYHMPPDITPPSSYTRTGESGKLKFK